MNRVKLSSIARQIATGNLMTCNRSEVGVTPKMSVFEPPFSISWIPHWRHIYRGSGACNINALLVRSPPKEISVCHEVCAIIYVEVGGILSP